MNNFYVYQHIRLDTNTPFYVGKGKARRAFNFTKRNQYWKNIVKKYGIRVEILLENLDESDAFLCEIAIIAMYKIKGLCEANISLGGLGGSHPAWNAGIPCSEETRTKIAAKLTGTILSDETKAKLRLKRVGRKPALGTVRNALSKQKTSFSMQEFIYKTPKGDFKVSKDAAVAFKVSYHTIIRWCRANKSGFQLIQL